MKFKVEDKGKYFVLNKRYAIVKLSGEVFDMESVKEQIPFEVFEWRDENVAHLREWEV
jgi:hypothetical protein